MDSKHRLCTNAGDNILVVCYPQCFVRLMCAGVFIFCRNRVSIELEFRNADEWVIAPWWLSRAIITRQESHPASTHLLPRNAISFEPGYSFLSFQVPRAFEAIMAPHAVIPVLVVGMLLTGVCNTLLTKYQV